MNKPARIALISIGGIVLPMLMAAVSALLIAGSDWLREKLRAATGLTADPESALQ
jgi:hypothetical protein